MPTFDTLLDIAWPLAAAIAVAIAGGIAFVAHEHAARLQRKVDAIPQSAELERVAEELETKRRQLTDLEIAAGQARGLQAQEAELRARLATLEQREQAQRASLESLDASVSEKTQALERAREDLQDLVGQLRQAEHSLDERTREETHASARLSEHRSQLGTLEGRQNSLITEIEALQRQHLEQQTRLEATHDGLQQLQSELASTRLATDAINSELDVLRQRRDDLAARVRDLDALADTKATVVADLPLLQSQRDALAQRAAAIEELIEAESRKLDALRADVHARQRTLTELQERIDDATATLDTLGPNDNHEHSATLPEYRTRLAALWEPVLECKALSTVPLSERAALTRVTDQLQRSGLIFHERTVYQFHTALKVANEAPLLVLAGISGTGKSLLPQRYAAALGINQLVIPVQPRWDGPQDLVGFFNHLEQKYVATPLSRALLQMHLRPEEHEHLHPPGFNSHSLSDQMLLVLLDEMNLARVEYYFAEFLSRLETRRTLTHHSTEADRRHASIPTECGTPPPNCAPLHLFPGSNVLFVGTMNEDETTQSLSDKVVDRANIIRFGMPRHMKAPDTVAFEPHQERLAHETWSSWITAASLAADDAARVQAFCDTINATLEPLGRAFGHRLLKAVSAYVRQYPAHVPDRVQRALADQIEMRILPRVRGVALADGTESLTTLTLLAREYEDEDLASAIENAQQSEMAARDDRFHWAGLSRSVE